MMDIISEFLSAFWPDGAVGRFHSGLAALALLAGPAIFLRRKGTLSHRSLGYLYVVSMIVVNVTALTRYEISGRPNLFHFFAVISLLTVIPGVRAAMKARRTGAHAQLISHYHFMSWSYFGLLAAFLSQVATQLGAVGAIGGGRPFLVISVATGLGAVLASILINILANRTLKTYAPEALR